MAIAFDAAASGNGSGTSLSFSHTCTGASMLIVGALCGSAQEVSGITYNGVAMTSLGITQADGGGYETTLWYLFNPASGANNVVISISGGSSPAIFGRSASYSGTSTSGIGSSANGSNTSTSRTQNLTTTTANSWTSIIARGAGDNISAGTGSTNRSPTSGNADFRLMDSNAALSAGSNSMTFTSASSQILSSIIMEVLEESAPAATARDARKLALLGVG